MLEVVDARCVFSLTPVPGQLLVRVEQVLTKTEQEILWKLFVAISEEWQIGNVLSFRSGWLEFIQVKMSSPPDFTAEYSNAASVVEELLHVYGDPAGYRMLLIDHGIPTGAPQTRLAHAKRFVVDEFIRVQILLGGFKSFVDPADHEEVNYRGYMGGSRYQRLRPVRRFRDLSKG